MHKQPSAELRTTSERRMGIREYIAAVRLASLLPPPAPRIPGLSDASDFHDFHDRD